MKTSMDKLPNKAPYIIHGNPCHIFPTHTHGLPTVGLPEMFINSKAYGPKENAHLINMVFIYLWFNYDIFEKVRDGVFVEIELPVFEVTVCIRCVTLAFLGTRKAYGEQYSSPTGFAQIYVKGDDHVLVDRYYQDDILDYVECKDCNSCVVYRFEKNG